MCKEEQVHRGPNDLEDMNMLRYKWLTGNGVARETMAKACSDVDNYLSQSFTAFLLKAQEQKKNHREAPSSGVISKVTKLHHYIERLQIIAYSQL